MESIWYQKWFYYISTESTNPFPVESVFFQFNPQIQFLLQKLCFNLIHKSISYCKCFVSIESTNPFLISRVLFQFGIKNIYTSTPFQLNPLIHYECFVWIESINPFLIASVSSGVSFQMRHSKQPHCVVRWHVRFRGLWKKNWKNKILEPTKNHPSVSAASNSKREIFRL